MEKDAKLILYFYPLSFPCGPDSSCCGPVGQSEEELKTYRERLQSQFPELVVEEVDVSKKLDLRQHGPVIRLLNSFGLAACPIFALNGEVISLGPPKLDELAALLRQRLPQGVA